MENTRWLVTVVALAALLTACGGGDDSSADAGVGGVDAPGGESGQPDAGEDPSAAPEIDPAAMPEPGNVRAEVEGSAYEYAQADAAASAYSCSVGTDLIVTELQVDGGAFTTQVNNASGDAWQGGVTFGHKDSDRIYSSLAGVDGTFAVDGTMAVYEGAFYWRTSAEPALKEDAGTGTVYISC